MKGFLYRTAIRLKNFGERLRLPVFIRLGLALKRKL